jgi:hypothetical protein
LSGAHRPTALHDAAACRQALGPHRYGQATRAPPVLLPPSGSYATQRKPFGRLRRARSTIGESAARAASGLLPSAVDCRVSGWLAFRWCRLPLPLGVLFGSESAACGRIDALVAVVPAAPIARRRIPSQHFPQRHQSEVGGQLTRTQLQHACRLSKAMLTPSLFVLAEDRRRQSSATATSARFHASERA